MKLLSASTRAAVQDKLPAELTASVSDPVPSRQAALADIQKQRLALKAELLNLVQSKEELLRTRKLWTFIPNKKQLSFFENAGKKRRAGFCGNRFGKSTVGVVEDCCWLIGYRPFFPEGHPLRTAGIPAHGVKGLVIGEDWDKVKEIFTNDEPGDRRGKFFDFLPEDMITKKTVTAKGIIDSLQVTSYVNGVKRVSLVVFDTVRSYKQNPASAESSDWDFIHVDEPLTKEHWTAASRGLIDRGGYSWWLLTPIKEPWMYNEIVENAKEDPDLYWFFEASMDDNPILSEEDKKLYLDQLPEDERQARRDGKPLAHARLVFGHFSEDYHVLDSLPADWVMLKPPFKEWMTALAVDTHPQTPHAGLFVAVNENQDIIIYDEIAQRGLISDLAHTIIRRSSGTRLAYALCEPAAWKEDQGTGHNYADIFAGHNLYVIPGSKRKEDAVLLTQELFKQRKRRVYIYKGCVNLIRELKHHHFDKENRPEDKNDHWIECLRRLVIHDNLTWYPAAYQSASQEYTTEEALKVSRSAELSLFNVKNGKEQQLNLLEI